MLEYAPICPGLLEFSNKINGLILLVVAFCWQRQAVAPETIAQLHDSGMGPSLCARR
jgi:hypothetical protein